MILELGAHRLQHFENHLVDLYLLPDLIGPSKQRANAVKHLTGLTYSVHNPDQTRPRLLNVWRSLPRNLRAALEFAEIALSGCFISCTIEAVIASTFISSVSRARLRNRCDMSRMILKARLLVDNKNCF